MGAACPPSESNTHHGKMYSKGTIGDASNLSWLAPYESFRVPFVDLEEATNNFDHKFVVSEGGFGKVYRGVLCDGTKVALKRYNMPEIQHGIVEFQTEIEILSQLHHPYLVTFIGYCDENNEMILVYDYMDNLDLKRHLYGSNLSTLTWEQRVEICIGAARCLHYLHTNSVIHVLCARPVIAPVLPREQVNLAEWAMHWQKNGQLEQIMDFNLVGEVRPVSLSKFGETAVKCLANYGEDRPSMGDVLWNLEYALHLQEAVIR